MILFFVGDIMQSSDDEDVSAKSEQDNRILITDDKDFGELSLATPLHPEPSRAIVER